jgi:hypothetical protein
VRLGFGFGACIAACVVALGCSGAVNKSPAAGKGGGAGSSGGGMSSKDGGVDPFGNASRDGSFTNIPEGGLKDASSTSPDAFFINDPPPPYCGPDAGTAVETPTGTIQCPSDKNREGCPCPEADMKAACWPGKRANRNHGICKDGETVCRNTPEFGLRWGACEGYVLPVKDALSGPEACGCFSNGKWALTNLSPCIFRGDKTYLYASVLGPQNQLMCGGPFANSDIPPAPEEDWTESTLDVDCAGQFRLCFTIKAGDVNNPRPDDCVIHEACQDVWYEEAGVEQQLENFPGWNSTDFACAAKFDLEGGYGEMSVKGVSIECDEVDDGNDGAYVFHRTNYCPPSCQQNMNTPECINCVTGGSGSF